VVIQGTFEVEILSRNSGERRWVRVSARHRDEAAAQVAALGEAVGEVRLVSVSEQNGSPGLAPPPSEVLPSEAGAITFAWLGILLGPLAVVGLIWGANLRSRTAGRRGTHAFVVGIIFTVLWGIWLLGLISGKIR
jgi:hypothetical protein